MKKRLVFIVLALAVGAAAAGLSASPSRSDSGGCPKPPRPNFVLTCFVSLTGTGPAPSTVTTTAGGFVEFGNSDSVSHTVVFANGRCSLTLAPGAEGFVGSAPACSATFPRLPFPYYAGTYAYTVDGNFAGTVVTTPLPRSVSLNARTHTIRGGTRLSLYGRVTRPNGGIAPPPPVVVLARHNAKQPFTRVATVRPRGGPHLTAYAWKLGVQPDVTTTYIAEVTAQRLCYYPVRRCARNDGQVWTNAASHPFTVRIGR